MAIIPLNIELKTNFIGREFEIKRLEEISNSKEASIIVMYGRRRVGKTELLEQTFRLRNVLKFEGIEGLDQHDQLKNAMKQLANYVKDPLLAKVVVENWSDFFQILAGYTKSGIWTIYLEELQWLANYKPQLISELKYVWDNFFRHNPKLILILCGSSPSFMIDKVVHSKALYNRSQYEFNLKELNIIEARSFLKKRSIREVFDAHLTIGGIPEYLKWINKDSSVFLSLCKHSFVSDSFFSHEYKRIFTSSMSENKHYRKIIEILSQKRFATRHELAKKLRLGSGGTLTDILVDLEKSGFVNKYYPYNLKENTTLTRYAISDNYLQFYFKFIRPIQSNIDQGDYNSDPKSAIKTDNYIKWLGHSFERFIRKNHAIIAKILGFSGVQYESGVYFSRATDKENPGYQIDLVFDRADRVLTICEVKYLDSKVTTQVVNEFEKKIRLLPNQSNKTIQKVLICNEGAEDALINRAYFDNIITAKDFLEMN